MWIDTGQIMFPNYPQCWQMYFHSWFPVHIFISISTTLKNVTIATANNRKIKDKWKQLAIMHDTHYATTAQAGMSDGCNREELLIPMILFLFCRLAWTVLFSSTLLSRSRNIWVTLLERQESGFTIIMSSCSLSLSSLEIISGVNTFDHFSFSFSAILKRLKIAWHSCNFWMKCTYLTPCK